MDQSIEFVERPVGLRTGVAIAGPAGDLLHADAWIAEALGLEPGGNIAAIAGLAVEPRNHGLARLSGRPIGLRGLPLPGGGAVLVAEAIDDGSAFRSIFENSVYGIYRDALDGTPLRCNPALARLNGYGSEADYLTAVSKLPGNWYVDPGRAAEFRRILQSEGRVRDLVSEVYRHHSREKVWITENAWYVRDAEGTPLYIEGTIQEASERVEGLAAVERQANTDALTGAASRFCFLNRLKAATQPQSPGAVLFIIDLDRFKEVNDMLGHTAGDHLLKAVAGRLQELAGTGGLVARLGGDEFAILQTGLHCHINADTTAAAIVKALRQPISIDGRNLTAGGSVGAAIYPAHSSSADELLNHADLALYQVKANGRNGFRMFDRDLKIARERRATLESELKAAIAGDELELYYQPLVDAATERITGFEALMRWNHPRRGFMPPSDFIALAEEAGLMTDLGNWAIRRACQQAATFPAHIVTSVNVSPAQFRAAGIVKVVRDSLAETGLAPNRLMLEVTESAILPGENLAAAIMADLQALGVQLALDDFGTGYSSLSYLQRFRFSKLKIDRSFVAGLLDDDANRAIIRATLSLCRDLSIDVVAEGIETTEQAELLRSFGGQTFQGYLYGKPRPYREALASVMRPAIARQELNLRVDSFATAI